MIKYIFFDFDGVITLNENAYSLVPENIHKYYPEIPLEQINKCYRPHVKTLQIGQKTHFDLWDEYCKCLNKSLPQSALMKAFRDTPLNEDIISLIKKVSKKYQIGIISNNTEERLQTLLDQFNIANLFNTISLSSQVGSTKNDKKIFEKALLESKIRANEAIFIDNNKENLEIPQRMGFYTYFFDLKKNDTHEMEKYFHSLGLKF